VAWQAFVDDHAIDVMVVVISFSDNFPDIAFRKVLWTVEDTAMAAGA